MAHTIIRAVAAAALIGAALLLPCKDNDDQRLAKATRKMAEQGLASAQWQLANFYAYGRGVPQDEAEALKWLRASAQQGETNAQYQLGLWYEQGIGVPKNRPEAIRIFRKLADAGLPEAQLHLGQLCELGKSVPQNAAEAEAWYRQAADQGNIDAQKRLGELYFIGNGIPRDARRAYVWLNIAGMYQGPMADMIDEVLSPQDAESANAEIMSWCLAHANLPSIQLRLAEFYTRGAIVAQDLVKAHQWICLAKDGREWEITSYWNGQTVKPTRAQMAEGKRKAEQFKR